MSTKAPKTFQDFCAQFGLTIAERRLVAKYLAFIRMVNTLKLASTKAPQEK